MFTRRGVDGATMDNFANKAQQHCELADELRMVASSFRDQKDREIILQYADEIEQLNAKSVALP
jgi:uncharacterized protein YydD (DUF2326 family)